MQKLFPKIVFIGIVVTLCHLFTIIARAENPFNTVECTTLFNPSCSPSTVCQGMPFSLIVGINDLDGGVLQWFDEAGNPISSSTNLTVNLPFGECGTTEVGYYATYTPADPNCPMVTSEVTFVTVYPAMSAAVVNQGCSVSLTGFCEDFAVSWVDTDGTTGSGPEYAAPTGFSGNGSVTFTMTNPGAPSACNNQVFTIPYACFDNTTCPSIGASTVTPPVICDGGSFNLDATVNNLDGGTLEWSDLNGNVMANGMTINFGVDACTGANPGFIATYYPANPNCDPVAAAPVFLEIYPTITADLNASTCEVSVENYCGDFPVSWTTDAGLSGSGDTFVPSPGDNGVVTFTIANAGAPIGCNEATFATSFNCPAVCPTFTAVGSSEMAVCHQGTFALNATMEDTDEGGSLVWTNSAGTVVSDPSNVSMSNTSCDPVIESFTATYTSTNANCPPVVSETVGVTIYPQVTGDIVESGCTIELTNVCPNYTVIWNTSTGKPGTGTTFVAEPGESGLVEFEIFNETIPGASFLCTYAATSTSFSCAEVACPEIFSPACNPPVICNGESFGLVLGTDNLDGGTLNWYDENGNLIADPDAVFVTADVCEEQMVGYYAEYTPTTAGCEVVTTEMAFVTVFPQINAMVVGSECGITLDNTCDDYVIAWTDSDGNTGSGASYTAADATIGQVTFDITHPGAPVQCQTQSVTANYSCGEADFFDLALTKTLAPGQSNQVSPGDTVEFIITVYNQGTVDAHQIFISDYMATGLILADPSWTDYGTFVTTIFGGNIPPGGQFSIGISFLIDDVPPQCIINYAEINSAKDPNFVSQGDIDSTPDYIKGNDGVQVDNAINDPNDEDDFDGEMLYIVDCAQAIEISAADLHICSDQPTALSATVEGDTGGTTSWFVADGTPIANPAAFTMTNTTCDAMPVNVYAVYEPTGDCPALTSDIIGITVYPAIELDLVGNGCTVTANTNCPNFNVSYVTSTSKSGVINTFTSLPGESGIIEFTVFNIDALSAPSVCQLVTASTSFDCADCPSLANAAVSTGQICSGAGVALSVDVIDPDGGSLIWLDGNGQVVANSGNVQLTNTNCTALTMSFTPQYVPATDACSTITLPAVTVDVFPQIVASTDAEDCSVVLTDLPSCGNYAITWADNLGNNGVGPVYNAVQGTMGSVAFTITNTEAGVPSDCQSILISSSFACAEPVICPSLFNPQTVPATICAGSTFDLSVGINNGDGGIIQWFDQSGVAVNNSADILLTTGACNTETFGYYATYTPINSECPTVTTETVFVSIYPQVSAVVNATECNVSLTDVCPDFEVSWTDNLGNIGSSTNYAAVQGTMGTVNFSVTNPAAPSGCNANVFSAPFDCPTPVICPTLFNPQTVPNVLCEGETFDLIVGINNGDGGIIQWYDQSGFLVSNPADILLSIGSCNAETYGYYVTYTPANSDCEIFISETVTVTVYPTIEANVATSTCGVSLTNVCPDYDVVYVDGQGNTGVGSNYAAAAGTSGTVNFTINNPAAPAACQSAVVSGNYNCAPAVTCPNTLVPSISQSTICSGGNVGLSFTIADGDGGTVQWYDINGFPVSNPSAMTLTADGCNPTNYGFYAIYTPANSDCASFSSTVVSTTVYPAIEAVISENGGCAVTISNFCPNFNLSWVDNLGNSGTSDTYTPAPGESGTVTFNLTNPSAPAACSGASFSGNFSSCAQTDIFDLALIKTLAPGQASTVTPGSTVTFAIYVYNQGTVDAHNVQITDYIPVGLSLASTGWSVNGNTATTTLNNPIPAMGDAIIFVDFTVNSNATAGSLTNFAEISFATDASGAVQADIDSTPDGFNNNDGTPIDNSVNNPNDEDDHDPANVNISIPATCPSFGIVSCQPNAICSGQSVVLNAEIINGDGGMLVWYDEAGIPVPNPNSVVLTNNGCTLQTYSFYAYYVPSSGSCSPISSMFVSTVVYPSLNPTISTSPSGCTVSIMDVCSNFNVNWTDNNGNTGSGPSFVAGVGTSGTVTFTVDNPSAPNSCNSASLTANYDCGSTNPCPVLSDPSISSTQITSGGTISLGVNLTNGDGGQLFWYEVNGSLINDPNNVVVSSGACGGSTVGYYAIYYPADANCPVVTSQVVSVSVYPTVTGNLNTSSDGCSVNLTGYCTEYTVTWIDNNGNTGSGPTYVATPGTSGSVTFSIVNNVVGTPTFGQNLELTNTYSCADMPGGGGPCDTLFYCTQPMESINICPNPCTIPGEWYISNIQTDCGCVPSMTDNCFEYTPFAQTGTEFITVTVCNADYCENIPVMITLDDDCFNDSPLAEDDIFTSDMNTTVSLDVTSNDSDNDGDEIFICAYEQALNGTISLNNGMIEYTPNTGFVGTDYFTYTLCDGNQSSSQANVFVNVNTAATGLSAGNDELNVLSNEAININVQANDTYPTGCSPVIVITSSPTNGSVVVTDAGFISFTPDPMATGYDSFTYQLCCGTECVTAMVELYLVEARECDGLILPNGFSPNGDGVNERFEIPSLESCFTDYEKELLIFDRFGEVIYQELSFDNNVAWNGSSQQRNTLVPEGTYFFVLKFSKGISTIEQTGSVKVKF